LPSLSALMDGVFPDPKLDDDRFELAVQVISDTIAERGYAEMWNFPRSPSRRSKEARPVSGEANGLRGSGACPRKHVVFICEPIHQQHAEEHGRQWREPCTI
jgi:hypothetical protein